MIVEELRKVAKIFRCDTCDYTTSRKSSYDKHLSTGKHKMVVNGSEMVVKSCDKEYDCICGKSYKHESGYYRHKKSCAFVEEKEEEKTIAQNSGGVDNEIVMLLVKNQSDFQNLVVKELIPHLGNTMIDEE